MYESSLHRQSGKPKAQFELFERAEPSVRCRMLIIMSRLFRFPNAAKRDPAIDAWFRAQSGQLGKIAKRWFDVLRNCGDDVRVVLHDGHPTACVGDAAFAYVSAFTKHVNVGFFCGSEIADPALLLEGAGKYMRHVKLRPECEIHASSLQQLIETAYANMVRRLREV